MASIKNIIFDLGGVLLDIDFAKTEQAFEALHISSFHKFFSQENISELFEQLETGQLSPTAFYEAFRQQTKTTLTNETIQKAWNALLGKFFTERIALLKELKNNYRLFLFSNTNAIHYEAFSHIYQKQFGDKNFELHFIKTYYSHEVGYRKPYPQSFLRILEEQQLKASETLFIDDTAINIEGAGKAGLQTLHLLPHEPLLL
jgi:putative hydrolase of the HAD superfamily